MRQLAKCECNRWLNSLRPNSWEVIEESDWIITGTSSESPDSAKEDLINKANLIGANAIFYLNIIKQLVLKLVQDEEFIILQFTTMLVEL